MAEATSSSAGQARQELLLTRIYGAPRSLVFKAWTDPKAIVVGATEVHQSRVRAGCASRRADSNRHAGTRRQDLPHEGRVSRSRRA